MPKTSFLFKSMQCCSVVLLLFVLSSCTSNPGQFTLQSPNGVLALDFFLSESGQPFFRVSKDGEVVIKDSGLGLVLESEDLGTGLKVASLGKEVLVEDHYKMIQGKQTNIDYSANERQVSLKNKSGEELQISFRVSNDGVGFKYSVPNSKSRAIRVTDELTQFAFNSQDKMWVQPMSAPKSGWMRTNPSYEEPYFQGVSIDTPSPIGFDWIYPALFQVGDQWILISETGMEREYAASRLSTSKGSFTVELDFPPSEESINNGDYLPNSKSALSSPWRIITVGSLETLVESTLGTDLAKPAKPVAVELKAGYASWSWALLKDNSVVYDVQKKFIDYASEMKWQYCLVDVNWDRNIGYEKIGKLAQYAQSKGVGLLLWYNSSGDWNDTEYTPKSKLLTHNDRIAEFQRIKDLGVVGVKIDFFGGDGQSVIAHYEDILIDAAEVGLMVNFHGATLPRGWQRTYPNLMTVEAIKGFEFITFTQDVADLAPQHCATIPFTRNVFDPMDFTPMAFSEIPGIQKRTTDGFELALPTLFLSGIQHLAEIPEGMKEMPDFVIDYLSDLPTSWDEAKLITGFPGKDVVIARRSGSEWYITGINGEAMPKTLELDLSFLEGATGIIIKDDAEVSNLEQQSLTIGDSPLELRIPANGGFIIKVDVD